MDYEVGSIADLISGDRTPNRPRVSKKPLTPVKLSTPPSTNVTPRENKKLGKIKTPKIAFTPETVNSPRAIALKNQTKNEYDSPKGSSKKRKSKLFNNDSEESLKEVDEPKINRKSSNTFKVESIEAIPQIKERRHSSNVNTSINISLSAKKVMSLQNQLSPKEKRMLHNMRKDLKKKDDDRDEEDDVHEGMDNILEEGIEKEVDTEKNANEESDEETEFKKAAAKRVEQKERKDEKYEPKYIDRTLFVGNIPITILRNNHERVLRGRFSKFGTIETIRMRNIPVPDMETKPKVAFIKKKFHIERSTVIAYIQFSDPASVFKALVENNTILEGNHLRVDRCYPNGMMPVDPKKSLFCGNLPFNVEDETLRKFFEKCGEIESVRVVRDRKTQIGKGIAFVNFASPDGVELALAMDEEDLKIGDRQFRIKRYNAADKGENNSKGNPRKRRFEDGKQLPKQDYRKRAFNKPFGKKRDEQGNKIRKRNFDKDSVDKSKLAGDMSNGDGPVAKKLKKGFSAEQVSSDRKQSNEGLVEKKSRMERQSEYKGLVAQKKKKMKKNKADFEKKKMSKILTQPPKSFSED